MLPNIKKCQKRRSEQTERFFFVNVERTFHLALHFHIELFANKKKD